MHTDLFNAAVSLAPLAPKDKATVRRDAIKAAGGAEYEALRKRARDTASRFRQNHPELVKYRRRLENRSIPFKTALCANARARGRKRGLPATIIASDLEWPSHCPVLGLELDYPARTGTRGDQHAQPNWPSLDRWDSTKGYVPGNVFVISYRANTLKNSATYEEILRVAKYLSRRPR